MRTWGKYLLAVAAVAVFLDDKALYVLLYVLLGIVFIGEYLMRDVASKLVSRIYIDSDRLDFDQTATLVVEVSNPTRIPIPWVLVRLSLPSSMVQGPLSWVASLPSRGSAKASYTIVGARRGAYPLNTLTVGIGDGLSDMMHEGRPPISGPAELVVYPRTWSVDRVALPSRQPYGQTRTSIKFYEDPSRAVGVRDYVPGDNPRRINWKATAKVGELQVKEFQPTITLDTLILLDLDPADYPQSAPLDFTELAIEVAASMALRLLVGTQSVGLVTNVGRNENGPCELVIRPSKGVTQLGRIMDLLARVAPREGLDFARTVQAGRLGIQPGSTVICIVPGERRDVLDSCLVLQKAGYKVLVVVLGGVDATEAIGGLMYQGVKVLQVFSTRDLERLAS